MPRVDQLSAALLASKGDAIIAADTKGLIQFWNPGAERIFGYAATEALGQSLDLIIPDALRKRHWQGYEQVMRTGRSRYGEGDLLAVPGQRKDGKRISLELDRKSTRLNSSHVEISYAVFCLKKKKNK